MQTTTSLTPKPWRLAGVVGGVWSPEDLAQLEGTPWVLVSAMRRERGVGALLAVNSASENGATVVAWDAAAEAGRLGAERFDPHGIDTRPLGDNLFEVLVVDHGAGEAVARLTIDVAGERPVVRKGERIEQPAGTSGNAVAHDRDGGFVLTSMFDPNDPGFVTRLSQGEPTGGVWRWSADGGWRRLGPRLSGANGIVVAEDRAIIVSEWATQKLWRLSAEGEVEARVALDFLPDNLRWTPKGDLLLAGQISDPKTLFERSAAGLPCPMGYQVVRVEPTALRVTPLIDVSDVGARTAGFGGATGAAQIGEQIWVGSFTGESVGRFLLGEVFEA